MASNEVACLLSYVLKEGRTVLGCVRLEPATHVKHCTDKLECIVLSLRVYMYVSVYVGGACAGLYVQECV